MNEMEYLELVEEVAKHDRYYYIEAKPRISDYAYDQLYKKLQLVEKEHPEWISSSSPTQRIGDPLTEGFKQVAHTYPLFSLENTYDRAELKAFIDRVHKLTGRSEIAFSTELKMDGIAVSVLYKKGLYTQALTRGDGKKGDDVTANMKTIHTLPLKLFGKGVPDSLEIRGEVFMPIHVFKTQNSVRKEKGEEPWANPRNAAAGSLKLLDPEEVALRKLSCVFYGIAETKKCVVPFQHQVHDYLEEYGLPVFDRKHRAVCSSIDEILEFASTIKRIKSTFDFQIDGIVIKLDSITDWFSSGWTRKAPRWAVAYKFSPEQAVSRIHHITVQVGRSGVLTPVAELEPIFLAGSTISRATLYNQDEISRKDVREGDWVVIEKGGEVIPQVVSVDLSKRPSNTLPWKMPDRCPSCGGKVSKETDQVNVRCLNQNQCKQQRLQRLIHFAGKHGMNIEYLGKKILEKLFNHDVIQTIVDIYELSQNKLITLTGFKEKSIEKLLSSLARSREVTLSRFIAALGIPNIGEEMAYVLATQINSVEKLASSTKEELLKINGIGEKTAQEIVLYFQNPNNLAEIQALRDHGIKLLTEEVPKPFHPFYQKKFVLTGTLNCYSRDEATRLIQERGGKVVNGISPKVDYVIVGEQPGSKLEKARKIQLTLWNEREFKEKL